MNNTRPQKWALESPHSLAVNEENRNGTRTQQYQSRTFATIFSDCSPLLEKDCIEVPPVLVTSSEAREWVRPLGQAQVGMPKSPLFFTFWRLSTKDKRAADSPVLSQYPVTNSEFSVVGEPKQESLNVVTETVLYQANTATNTICKAMWKAQTSWLAFTSHILVVAKFISFCQWK